MRKTRNMKCYFCGNEITDYIKSKHFDILKCKYCSICVTHPAPIMIDYNRLDFNPILKDNDCSLTLLKDLPADWKDALNISVSLVENNLRKRAKILEIGCGEGILLKEFQNCGFRVKGIEPSIQGSNKARLRGLDVVTGFFPNEFVTDEYDLIVMSQVLEHISDPETVINKIKGSIPNGLLMLTQTNYEGLFPFLTRGKWYAWVPEQHYWHFTPRGLEMYLSKFGFKKIDAKYSHLVHRHNIVYGIASLRDSWKDQFTMLFKLAGK